MLGTWTLREIVQIAYFSRIRGPKIYDRWPKPKSVINDKICGPSWFIVSDRMRFIVHSTLSALCHTCVVQAFKRRPSRNANETHR